MTACICQAVRSATSRSSCCIRRSAHSILIPSFTNQIEHLFTYTVGGEGDNVALTR
jgi:hypothetical protein